MSDFPSSINVSVQHGPILDTSPQLYGIAPKRGSLSDTLSFHLVYCDVPVPMRDGVQLIGQLIKQPINQSIKTYVSFRSFITISVVPQVISHFSHSINYQLFNHSMNPLSFIYRSVQFKTLVEINASPYY